MDFYYKAPEMAIFLLLLEMHQETFTLGDPEEPYQDAQFEVMHLEVVDLFRGGQQALVLDRVTKQQQRRSLNPALWIVWLRFLLLPLLLILFWQQVPAL